MRHSFSRTRQHLPEAGANGTPTGRTGRALQRRVQPHSLISERAHVHPNRILMTADCVGGVWTYALDLARGLSAHDIEVVLATMGDLPSPQQSAQARQIPGLTLCSSNAKLEWMHECWADVARAGEWLLALEEQYAPDIIHLNGYAHAALPWAAPVVVVAHSDVLSWWQAVKGEPAPPEWNQYREHITIGLHSADCVIAPTSAMLRALDYHYGFSEGIREKGKGKSEGTGKREKGTEATQSTIGNPQSAIENRQSAISSSGFCQSKVIPNGRQHSLYYSAEKEPFILTAGRAWDEAKNIALLEQAAPPLAWPVYVAGSPQHPAEKGTGNREQGTAGEKTEDRRQKTEPTDALSTINYQLSTAPASLAFLGALSPEALSGWYARAAIYALPARYEPFGLSALEAALSGCALVLGDIGSLREVWGEAALFIAPNDADALRRSLSKLIADPALRQEMADRAWERAQIYTLDAMTDGYLDIYGQLLTTHLAVPHYSAAMSFPPEPEESLP